MPDIQEQQEFDFCDELEYTGSSLERGQVTDPHDGILGWWRVDGLRHSALVHCASAAGAIIRADEEELVDRSWEMPMVTWIGERLPNAIRC